MAESQAVIKVNCFMVGMVQTNFYYLHREGSKETIAFDPADLGDRICDELDKQGLEVKAIFLTHAHFDHIMALNGVREATGAPLLHHEAEAGILHDNDKNLFARFSHRAPTFTPADRLLADGDTVTVGRSVLTVCHTPGHTPGSICLLDRKDGFLYSGDAINGQAWLQLDHSSSLKVYLESLNALDAYRPFFTELHNGHNVEAIPAAYIDEVREGVKTILATGGAGDEDYEWFGGICKRHMLREDAWILYTPDKL
jgi:glyoxylase-like metal-dependent hydrolase (beta-lactamase superfamily II)